MASRIASPLQDEDHLLLQNRVPKSFVHDKDNGKSGLKRNGWKRKLLRMPRARREAARKTPLQRSPLKRESKGRKAELAKYRKLSAIFLARPENRLCGICQARREAGENVLISCATEIHHRRGRSFSLLCDTRHWTASCRSCRDFPHSSPKRARQLGLLASPVLWNVVDRT
jgi:hypothetical protein